MPNVSMPDARPDARARFPRGGAPAMEVRGLSFSYGANRVLDGVDLLVPQGKVTTILGGNGCGKSTLFALMTKNLVPDRGKVFLWGRNIQNIPLRDFARQVSIVHQGNTAASDITVEQLVRLGRAPHLKPMTDPTDEDARLVEWALEVTGTAPYRLRELSRLSGGQRQRVWIAMALAQNTRILFLDEPTTYLDIRYQLDILDLVRRLNREFGITVVMVLHDINQAIEYSDVLVGLKGGRVALCGSPQEVVTEDSLRGLFDVKLEVASVGGRKRVLLRDGAAVGEDAPVPEAPEAPGAEASDVPVPKAPGEPAPEASDAPGQPGPDGAGPGEEARPAAPQPAPDLVSEATRRAMERAAAGAPGAPAQAAPNPHVSAQTLAAMRAAGHGLSYELPSPQPAADEAQAPAEPDGPRRSSSRLARVLWAGLGLACFGLGTLGVVLPILPTVPLYLAALFCFAKGSRRLHDWFVGTSLYHKHLEGFVAHRGMTLRTKLSIMGMVTLVMAIAFIMMSRVPVGRVILVAVWVFHVVYFTFFVKTDRPADGAGGEGEPAGDSRLAYEGNGR